MHFITLEISELHSLFTDDLWAFLSTKKKTNWKYVYNILCERIVFIYRFFYSFCRFIIRVALNCRLKYSGWHSCSRAETSKCCTTQTTSFPSTCWAFHGCSKSQLRYSLVTEFVTHTGYYAFHQLWMSEMSLPRVASLLLPCSCSFLLDLKNAKPIPFLCWALYNSSTAEQKLWEMLLHFILALLLAVAPVKLWCLYRSVFCPQMVNEQKSPKLCDLISDWF